MRGEDYYIIIIIINPIIDYPLSTVDVKHDIGCCPPKNANANE